MGNQLLDIIEMTPFYIHNDGSPTYFSGDKRSAPDVTLSYGIVETKETNWLNLDDDLGSPHHGLLLQIGGKRPFLSKSIINWKTFPWDSYKEESSDILANLLRRWNANKTDCVTANGELTDALLNLTEELAEKKRVCTHSKPWINKKISESLKLLRDKRKKMSYHRSPGNVKAYKDILGKTLELINEEYEKWWSDLCGKLPTLEGKEKWKVIHTLMDQTSPFMNVKPIRKTIEGKSVYLFEDQEISKELEDYHITKPERPQHPNHIETSQIVKDLLDEAGKGKGCEVMNADITDIEVKKTFGKCSGASGNDKIKKELIDKADRNQMQACLKYIYSQAWRHGQFPDAWKMENRNVLAKPDKEDYHVCEAYRTVSVTSIIGKRFEHITSQRLLAAINSDVFDENQFAYLKGRSTTQAILVVAEKIKKGLMSGQVAGAIFFDLSDAFGSVDRQLLLLKLGKDLNISGRLLLHLNSFLTGRKARIILNGKEGEWIDSIFGTSAGTILGSLLFIIHIYDAPKQARPKFADDISAVEVANDVRSLQAKLQEAANEIKKWADKWGLDINLGKTKSMAFGSTPPLDIQIGGIPIKKTEEQRLLGVILDKNLDFNLQVDHAISKARKTFGKLAYLIKGRKGLPVKEAIEIFKGLVRHHLEYAFPSWANLKENEIKRLEVVQSKCLRQLIGAKAHSTTDGMEVLTNVPPFRLRTWDLCMREYIRIKAKDPNHKLRSMMRNSMQIGQTLSPCAYLIQHSREWTTITEDLELQREQTSTPKILLNAGSIEKVDLFQPGTMGNSSSRSCLQKEHGRRVVEEFIHSHKGTDVMIFTDGSVANGPYGSGACAILLLPLESSENETFKDAVPVGTYVENVECEFQGIILALQNALKYFGNVSIRRKHTEMIYVLCDCESAIDIVLNRNMTRYHTDKYLALDNTCKRLKDLNVKVSIIWIPGHVGIKQNELVDQEAKRTAKAIADGNLKADTRISIPAAIKLAKDLMTATWQRRWDVCETGATTKLLIPKVISRIYFPADRCTGISYIRLLLDDTTLNVDQYKMKLVLSPVCDFDCDEDLGPGF